MLLRVVVPICLLLAVLATALWFQSSLTSEARARGVRAGMSDALVLDIGGDHPRLTIPRIQPVPDEPTQGNREPQTVPDDPPKVEARRRWARLQKGETVYAICVRELGGPQRLREVLELNGLTEEGARSLAPGAVIELPPR